MEENREDQPIHDRVAEQVVSPCIGFCILDEYGYCGGCHRTMAEILAWPEMSDARKREVLDRIARRVSGGGDQAAPKG